MCRLQELGERFRNLWIHSFTAVREGLESETFQSVPTNWMINLLAKQMKGLGKPFINSCGLFSASNLTFYIILAWQFAESPPPYVKSFEDSWTVGTFRKLSNPGQDHTGFVCSSHFTKMNRPAMARASPRQTYRGLEFNLADLRDGTNISGVLFLLRFLHYSII